MYINFFSQFNEHNFDFKEDMVMMGRSPYKSTFELDNARDYEIVNESLKKVSMDKYSNRNFSTLFGGRKANTNLCGFFHCNGCDSDLSKDLDYKINQLKKLDVKTIHMPKCIDVECNRYDEIKNFLLKNKFNIVNGTH